MKREPCRHWQSDLVSVIIPVLEIKRARRLRYLLARRRGIAELLDDLEHSAGVALEIIVICNSSEQELVEFVTNDSRINKYCLNSVNVGVARSWNMGAMMAEGEFLCFLNDDAALHSNSIQELAMVINSSEDIGIVGVDGGAFFAAGPGQKASQKYVEDVDRIEGWFFMVKRKVFDQVGGFDVCYTPASYEETDFSFLVREAGYRCVVKPGAGAEHHGQSGVSSRKTVIRYLNKEIDTVVLNRRNKKIFFDKWISRKIEKR